MSTVRETFGLACPKCGQDNRLVVAITTFARLYPDGTEIAGDQLWSEDGYCCCEECQETGTVAGFRIDNGGPS